MRRSIGGCALLLTGCLGCLGCLHAPMPWSPDGSWIVYTVEVRAPDAILKAGWLFDRSTPASPERATPVVGYRLWATRSASGESVLLEDSSGAITAPGWSPDGRALAFGRVVTGEDRTSRFEVVVLEGLTRRRVVSSRPLTALDAEATRLAYQAIAWSPDGRYLAVPQLEPVGLAIIRADNGRAVNVIPDAFLPSWSPTGGRLAFYLRSGGHTLHYLESALGQPRPLIDVGQASQAPCWNRDGSSLIVVARRASQKPGEAGNEVLDLVQVHTDKAVVETLRSLSTPQKLHRDQPIEGSSITADRDLDNIFSSIAVEGQPNEVTWYRPKLTEVHKKFPIIDDSIPIGSLSFSPDGKTLAARVGPVDQLAAPLLCDTESSELEVRLIAPDDSTRLDWIATLIGAARRTLAELPATRVRVGSDQSLPINRPTLLPLLTELTEHPETLFRLRRIGKHGRTLCDQPSEARELNPTTRDLIREARLFFDYLREDYSAALVDLDALELDSRSPEHRLALLTIRAQILVNQGRFVAAKRVINFLDQADRPIEQRIEWTGQQYVMTSEPRADHGWPRFLAESSARLQATLNDPKPDEPEAEGLRPGMGISRRPQVPSRPILPNIPGPVEVISPRPMVVPSKPGVMSRDAPR